MFCLLLTPIFILSEVYRISVGFGCNFEPTVSKFMNRASYLGFFNCYYEHTGIQSSELCIIFVIILAVNLNVPYSLYELYTVFVFIWDKILKVLVFNL